MKVRIAGITSESLVDGPGLRAVIFFQGCPHRCVGCQNPETWSKDGGTVITVRELIQEVNKQLTPLHSGITISGGEPIEQSRAVGELVKWAKETNFDVVLYTGYTLQELITRAYKDPAVVYILNSVDWLVDGRFVKELHDPKLKWRGSSNQNLYRKVDGSWVKEVE